MSWRSDDTHYAGNDGLPHVVLVHSSVHEQHIAHQRRQLPQSHVPRQQPVLWVHHVDKRPPRLSGGRVFSPGRRMGLKVLQFSAAVLVSPRCTHGSAQHLPEYPQSRQDK